MLVGPLRVRGDLREHLAAGARGALSVEIERPGKEPDCYRLWVAQEPGEPALEALERFQEGAWQPWSPRARPVTAWHPWELAGACRVALETARASRVIRDALGAGGRPTCSCKRAQEPEGWARGAPHVLLASRSPTRVQ